MIGAGTAQVNQWPVGGLQHLGEREACRLAHLLPRIDLLPRLAVAGTEIPIVEDDRAEAGASASAEASRHFSFTARVDVVARILDRDPQSGRRAAGCRV